jgi:hypothetical protein
MKTKAMVAAEESDSEDWCFETRPKKKSKTNSFSAISTNDLDEEEASLAVPFALAADFDDHCFDINDNFENYKENLLEGNNKSGHDTDKGEENVEEHVENIEYDEMEHCGDDPWTSVNT